MKIFCRAWPANSEKPNGWTRWAGILPVVAILLFTPTVAASQDVPPPVDETRSNYLIPQPAAPVLAGHRFVATTAVPNPFVRTQFRNTLGVGVSSGLSLPLVEIGGIEYRFETGKLLFSTLQIEYQQKIRDWLGVWARYGLAARLGTETQSLLTQGVTVTSGFELGWLVKLWQKDNMLLSGTAEIDNSSYTAVDLIGFIEGIIEGPPESENALVFTVPLMVGSVGLRYAWAMNQVVGLTAATKVGYGESPDRISGNEWYYNVGAIVDFDLRRRYSAPVGLAAGARVSSILEQDQRFSGSTKSTLIRLDYIGRIDFGLGLEVNSTWYNVTGYDGSLRYTTAAMDFRYYF